MNPLQRAGRSLRTARQGTMRTLRWAGGGIASAPRRARWRLAEAVRREGTQAPDGNAAEPADSGPGPIARMRANPRRAWLWAGGALLIAAWVGWATYVWIENGAAAGIGVLISWPAVFAALALVTAPVWGASLFLRQRRVAAANGAGLVEGSEATEETNTGDEGEADEAAAESTDAEAGGDASDGEESS